MSLYMSSLSISNEGHNQVPSFADWLQMNVFSGIMGNLFQSKIVVFQPVLVHARPLALRDVYRCEQRSAAWAYRWLASSLSLPVSDSCGETGGKLALTSLWVRVSKCCSHYKRPRDDCGNKVAEKTFQAAFHKLAFEPGGRNCAAVFFFILSSRSGCTCVLGTDVVLGAASDQCEVETKTRPAFSRPPLPRFFINEEGFFSSTGRHLFYCVYLQPTQVESLSRECDAQLYRQFYQGTSQC